MLKIEGKTFMNIQEAVQWLLDNNALPFQSSANYIANTEIGLGTIVNPSPAKVRIGSLIFFADSKVSTVTGLTENGFIVSDQYNNLVDDVAYVTNVAINASGHLITTMSDGQTIDAGIIKQITYLSINGSQHLIAHYNDGTSDDLGAIFSGNITIGGNLTVTGDITGPKVDCTLVTGDEIKEKMTGYSFGSTDPTNATLEKIYAGIVKNGDKLTLAFAFNVTRSGVTPGTAELCNFFLPAGILAKLFPTNVGGYAVLASMKISATKDAYNFVDLPCIITKGTWGVTIYTLNSSLDNLTLNDKYYIRIEATFLLSANLAS